jgi:hypothetical protein
MKRIEEFSYEHHIIDPTLLDEELVRKMEQFPEFKIELHPELDKAKVIRFIVLFYDMAEEISKMFPDVMVRKLECATMAGFKRGKDRKFDEHVGNMLIGRNKEANRMIARYVKLSPEPDYPSYVSYQSMLMQQIVLSMATTEPKEIKEIRQNITDLNKQISVLTERMFRGDTSQALIKALYSSMEEEKLGIRPEDIAKALKDGTLDIGKGQYEEIG